MKIRVLHVYPQINCGGTEMVFYNLIRYGNRDSFEYEILTQREGDNEEAFRELGIKINRLPKHSEKDYSLALVRFLKLGNYDVVHAHMHGDLPMVLKAASEANIPCRVAHSHNARIDIPRFAWPLLYFRHHSYEKYATLHFGCSSLALRWLYPSKWRKGHVIPNGIDLEKFRYNPQLRQSLREQFKIKDATKVFINVGRCTDQKNQKFILELAKDRQGKDELFVIIGEGPRFEDLKILQKNSNLNNVLLLGKRFDVPKWLSAADIFLFPSIYEGLGIVAIEAEAAGMQVLSSNDIPAEADMGLGIFQRISLNDKSRWRKLMDETPTETAIRSEISKQALTTNYNIHNVTKQVETIYLKNI